MSTSDILHDSYNKDDYIEGSSYLESIKYMSIYDSCYTTKPKTTKLFPEKNNIMLYNAKHYEVLYENNMDALLADPDPILPPTIDEFYSVNSEYLQKYMKQLFKIQIMNHDPELITKELLNINPICNYFSYFYSENCFITGIIDKVLSDKYKEITENISFEMIVKTNNKLVYYNATDKKISGGRYLLFYPSRDTRNTCKICEKKSDFLFALNANKDNNIIGYSDERIKLRIDGTFE